MLSYSSIVYIWNTSIGQGAQSQLNGKAMQFRSVAIKGGSYQLIDEHRTAYSPHRLYLSIELSGKCMH